MTEKSGVASNVFYESFDEQIEDDITVVNSLVYEASVLLDVLESHASQFEDVEGCCKDVFIKEARSKLSSVYLELSLYSKNRIYNLDKRRSEMVKTINNGIIAYRVSHVKEQIKKALN